MRPAWRLGVERRAGVNGRPAGRVWGECAIKNIFVRDSYLGAQMLILALLSLSLILVDHRTGHLDSVRRLMSSLLAPIQYSVNLPTNALGWVHDAFATRQALLDENKALRAKVMVLEGQVLTKAFLSAEVNRLRELLNASAILDESVLVAEIIGINPDPFVHEVIINKGTEAGAYVGQPVLDSKGLFGQITEANLYSSRVLMISDHSHAVPVQVNRNGVRAIAFGTGSMGELELLNVPETTDIKVGDLLVSSGLGGRFPAGYPVGQVAAIEQEPGQPFVRIRAVPQAELNRSRHVLLVFKREFEAGGSREAAAEPASRKALAPGA